MCPIRIFEMNGLLYDDDADDDVLAFYHIAMKIIYFWDTCASVIEEKRILPTYCSIASVLPNV
jgi:hypothetical protein